MDGKTMATKKAGITCHAINAHVKILLRGVARVLHAGVTLMAVCGVVFGFCSIQSESGYNAVLDFAGTLALLAVAVINIHSIGREGCHSGRN